VSLRQETLKNRKEDFRSKVLKIEKRSRVKRCKEATRLLCVSIRVPSTPDSNFLHVCLLSFALFASHLQLGQGGTGACSTVQRISPNNNKKKLNSSTEGQRLSKLGPNWQFEIWMSRSQCSEFWVTTSRKEKQKCDKPKPLLTLGVP
jgi:hypothetical protein